MSISNEGDAEAIGIAIVNTILGGSAGGITALILSFFENGKWSYLITLNGALTGTLSFFPLTLLHVIESFTNIIFLLSF